jgi:monolysocardiolipin acyltransferase
MDDPILFGLLPVSYYPQMRHSLGAYEILFTNPLTTRYFKAGRVIGIKRGSGIYQPGMNEALDVLNKDRWVHIFPEGKCNLDTKSLLPFKWGIARLIMESKNPVVCLPFYHHGMGEILPVKEWRKGFNLYQNLHVEFGQPVDFGRADMKEMFKDGDDIAKRIKITSFLQSKVEDLKRRHVSIKMDNKM